LPTDWHAPGAGALGRVPDKRAMQFWDPRHALSEEIRRTGQSKSRVVWDYVAIYPPGVRWTGAFPAARFAGAPVVRVIDDFRRQLMASGA
jgi:hypothetical protein